MKWPVPHPISNAERAWGKSARSLSSSRVSRSSARRPDPEYQRPRTGMRSPDRRRDYWTAPSFSPRSGSGPRHLSKARSVSRGDDVLTLSARSNGRWHTTLCQIDSPCAVLHTGVLPHGRCGRTSANPISRREGIDFAFWRYRSPTRRSFDRQSRTSHDVSFTRNPYERPQPSRHPCRPPRLAE